MMHCKKQDPTIQFRQYKSGVRAAVFRWYGDHYAGYGAWFKNATQYVNKNRADHKVLRRLQTRRSELEDISTVLQLDNDPMYNELGWIRKVTKFTQIISQPRNRYSP